MCDIRHGKLVPFHSWEKLGLDSQKYLRKAFPMVAPIPLEDTVSDILGKAQRGLSISDEALASRAGVPLTAIASLKQGRND